MIKTKLKNIKIHKFQLEKDEEMVLPIFWNGKQKELNYSIDLTKPGASIKLLMLIIGQKDKNVKINIFVRHLSPQTKSKVIVKGILNDNSMVDFNGLVKIEKKSALSDTWLAAHFLLLSENAKGRAVPSLEILENDIKAGHATTVGKVNEEEIFYLTSRGFNRKSAKNMIIQGFLSGFVNEFPDGKIKDTAFKQLQNAI